MQALNYSYSMHVNVELDPKKSAKIENIFSRPISTTSVLNSKQLWNSIAN